MSELKNKPVVAHYNSHFFKESETFIYSYISNHNSFYPICLAPRVINLDKFFFSYGDIYKISFFNGSQSVCMRLFGAIASSAGFNKDTLSFIKTVRVKKILNGRKARIIHAHFGHNGWKMLAVKKALNIPLVTTFYGFDISQLVRSNPAWKVNYKELFLEGDMFLVEGEYMKKCVLDLGCPKENVHLQRVAVDLNKISFRHRLPKDDDKITFIFTGRFTEKKGLIYALKAILVLKQKNYNIEFRIIGDGNQRRELDDFISNHNLQRCVRMLGFLDYGRYLDEMRQADIFVHPSVTASDGDSEGGAPTVILEAQAMGLPVISTYHADIPNVVRPNESAILSKERDWEGLAYNMESLIKEQERWKEMGQIGREFVQEYHNIDKEILNLEEKYCLLL